MKYNEVKISKDGTSFVYKNEPIFNKEFLEVLKFHSEGFAPVCDNSGWYHINLQGKELYNERYNRAFGYYCKRASVVLDNNWFHLNIKGNKAYSILYSWTGNFQENICTVRDFKSNYFHINLFGERTYKHNYLYAGDYKDGIACVKSQDGLYRHIDVCGNLINEKSFIELGIFHKNFAIAKDKIGWFHIGKDGNEIYVDRYKKIEPFYNGFALATKLENGQLIIDEKGNKVINF